MIGYLRGRFLFREVDGRFLIDVGGVGYAVAAPLAVHAQAEPGAELAFYIHTHVREDEIALFGFEDETQIQTYRALTAVSGIGPKVAMQILSSLTPGELAQAVAAGDVARLGRAKGIGKRLAERLAVELKGKLEFVPALPGVALGARIASAKVPEPFQELRSALVNLEYRPKEIDGAIAQVRDEFPEPALATIDTLLRRALALLRKSPEERRR